MAKDKTSTSTDRQLIVPDASEEDEFIYKARRVWRAQHHQNGPPPYLRIPQLNHWNQDVDVIDIYLPLIEDDTLIDVLRDLIGHFHIQWRLKRKHGLAKFDSFTAFKNELVHATERYFQSTRSPYKIRPKGGRPADIRCYAAIIEYIKRDYPPSERKFLDYENDDILIPNFAKWSVGDIADIIHKHDSKIAKATRYKFARLWRLKNMSWFDQTVTPPKFLLTRHDLMFLRKYDSITYKLAVLMRLQRSHPERLCKILLRTLS
jgi:hypothetical protein